MKVEDARRILGVSADSTEEEVKKAFRKHAMKWHPDKAGNVSDAVREDRTNKMKEINSAYVCLTQGESEQVDDFPEGFPWNMPEEVLASLMEQLFSTRMGGMRGARPRNSKGGRPQSFFPMGFSFEPMGEDPHSCDYSYHCDDSDDDDSDEYYPAGRSQRRHYQRRNNCSHEDLEKNRQAERNLHEHQKREAERLACDKQKAAVMKLIGKLAKPTKTVIEDTSISLTIDRNKKLHSELPDGGFWELQYKETHSRGSDSKWAAVSTYLRKTTVKVGQLTPGTSYDFRARGGYRSQLTGTDTLGDFSVVATLSTTGTKPKAPEVVPEPQKAAKSAAPEDTKQKKGKGGKGSNGAQNRTSESNEERGGMAEQQARPEEEAKKKLQREAVQKAQREKEVQQQAAEAAKKRQEEAKRDAEKNNAVQMRLAREAEEYQQLMAEHAHQGAGNNGKSNGSAPESKASKKKKKKKKTKPMPEDPALSESHQQSVQSESYTGNAGNSSRKASGEQEDDASSAPHVKTSLSAEAEAIRAEALANGLDALGDEAFEALLEEQRAIAEECARNLAKQKQSSQQRNTPTSARSTQQPASTAGHAAAPPPSKPTSAHQIVPETAPGVAAGAPNSSTGVQWQVAAPAQPKHESSSNTQRTKPRPAAQHQHGSTGRGATRGAAVPCNAHVQRASVGALREEQVADGSCISDVNVSEQQQGGYASTGLSQTHAGHGRVSQPADGVAASQRRGGQLQSPDSNVSSQSAASFNASHASAVSGEHSHPREPKGPSTAHVPPHVPPQAPPQTHSYVDQSSHHSQGFPSGWHVPSSQTEHMQHPNGSQFPHKRMQHSTLPDSLDPYAKHSAQSIPRSRMQGMHDEQHHVLHNNFSAPVEQGSAYGNVRTHHSRYDSHQDYSLGNHFPPSAAAGWHRGPGPTWSQSEYQHPQAHAKYGPMGTQSMHGMRMQGEHPAQGGTSHMWSSAEGDAPMLHHQHGSHNMPMPPPHSRHLQQEHVWNDAISPAMQPPPPPRAANVGSGGAMGRRMHAQSNPSTRGALFQAYSKRHSGSDNWGPNGTNANRPIDQHSSLYGPCHQKEAASGPKPPLFSHSAHYTEPSLSPEPHSMHLPEDLLEPAGAPPFGPNHLEGSAPNHSRTQQHTVSPLQLDAQQLSQWATQQTTHQHVPPAYHHPVEWM